MGKIELSTPYFLAQAGRFSDSKHSLFGAFVQEKSWMRIIRICVFSFRSADLAY